MESYYICPFRYRLVLRIKKFTKNALTLTTQKSTSEFSLSLSHTYIGLPWGFNLNFDLKTRERIYARARGQPIPVKISIYEKSSGDTIEFLNNFNDSFSCALMLPRV